MVYIFQNCLVFTVFALFYLCWAISHVDNKFFLSAYGRLNCSKTCALLGPEQLDFLWTPHSICGYGIPTKQSQTPTGTSIRLREGLMDWAEANPRQFRNIMLSSVVLLCFCHQKRKKRGKKRKKKIKKRTSSKKINLQVLSFLGRFILPSERWLDCEREDTLPDSHLNIALQSLMPPSKTPSSEVSIHCWLALDKIFLTVLTKEIVLPAVGVVLIQYSSPHFSVPSGKGGCWKDRSLWHDHRWGHLLWERCPAPSQPTKSAVNKVCSDAKQKMKWHQGKMKVREFRPIDPALSMRGRLSSFSLSIILHETIGISGVHSLHCTLLCLLLPPEILKKRNPIKECKLYTSYSLLTVLLKALQRDGLAFFFFPCLLKIAWALLPQK